VKIVFSIVEIQEEGVLIQVRRFTPRFMTLNMAALTCRLLDAFDPEARHLVEKVFPAPANKKVHRRGTLSFGNAQDREPVERHVPQRAVRIAPRKPQHLVPTRPRSIATSAVRQAHGPEQNRGGVSKNPPAQTVAQALAGEGMMKCVRKECVMMEKACLSRQKWAGMRITYKTPDKLREVIESCRATCVDCKQGDEVFKNHS
jgi:hypothetical protein